MNAYAIIRQESDETIDFPVCASCLDDVLAEANTPLDLRDYGSAYARPIKCTEHNHQERCSCGRVVVRAPKHGGPRGNRWDFA
jgi:hypothetical protein